MSFKKLSSNHQWLYVVSMSEANSVKGTVQIAFKIISVVDLCINTQHFSDKNKVYYLMQLSEPKMLKIDHLKAYLHI